MAQPQPETAHQPPVEPVVYRPLSGLAVAGLGLACLFAAGLAVSAVIALVKGVPFFLPPWMLGLAIVAAVLSFLAQRQVRNSEGILSGLAVARWGFWLSALSGLGYVAFSFFTGLALTQQADAFLRVLDVDSGFFPRLQEAKDKPEQIDQAFLLTLTPSERTSDPKELAQLYDRPEKDGPGRLTKFRTSFMVRSIARNGAAARVAPLALQQWTYEDRRYTVERSYRITTAEAIFDMVLKAYSTEGAAGNQRKWLVFFPPTSLKVTYTPLGEAVRNAWFSAQQFVQTSLGTQGLSFGNFTDSTNWKRAVAGDPAGNKLRDRILEMLKKDQPGGRTITFNLAWDRQVDPWEFAAGRLRFFLNVSLRLKGPDIPIAADATLTVESIDQKIQSEQDLAGMGNMPTDRWRVVDVKFQRTHLAPG